MQPSVFTSSTEVEFLAASNAGKTALYIRPVLADLHIPQTLPALLYEDNCGAYLIASAHQPTKHSRHIDICLFAIQDWVESDLTALHQLKTMLNATDALTKPLVRLTFSCHCDVLLGNNCPPFCLFSVCSDGISVVQSALCTSSLCLEHGG